MSGVLVLDQDRQDCRGAAAQHTAHPTHCKSAPAAGCSAPAQHPPQGPGWRDGDWRVQPRSDCQPRSRRPSGEGRAVPAWPRHGQQRLRSTFQCFARTLHMGQCAIVADNHSPTGGPLTPSVVGRGTGDSNGDEDQERKREPCGQRRTANRWSRFQRFQVAGTGQAGQPGSRLNRQLKTAALFCTAMGDGSVR